VIRIARCLGPLSLVLALATPALAAPPGFAFLEIPVGARASAMGGALTTVSNGAEAMFSNPGAIAPSRGLEVGAGHSELIQKLRHDWFSVAGHAWGGGLGASFRALYSEPIEERDDVGNLIGSFGAQDVEFALGFSRRGPAGVELGATAQVVRERIANLAATTFAMGFGASWRPDGDRWRLGLAVQNVGPGAHYTVGEVAGETIGLPTAVQGGVSYALPMGDRVRVVGAVESRVTQGREAVGIAGVELADVSGAALRAGYRYNDDASDFSAGAGYAAGRLRLDYAWIPFSLDLGDTHRFQLTATF